MKLSRSRDGAFVVGILGAESTGKSALAQGLAASLRAEPDGPKVALVAEYLREFCDIHRRTPREDEQAAIAAEQSRRIDEAAATHDIVIADTTAIMIAVYSEIVFADTSLYADAERAHARCDLTLLTALDIPWQADGLMRDGPQVREPVDALIRAALQRADAPYGIIHGQGPSRLQAAEQAVARQRMSVSSPENFKPWKLLCDCCGDPDCERAMRAPLHRA